MAIDRKKRKITVKRPKQEKNTVKEDRVKQTKSESEKREKASSKEKHMESESFKVLSGAKKKRRITQIISVSVIAVIIITVLILNFLTPTGLIEYLQNGYAAMGSGQFPVNVYSTNSTYFGCKNGVVTTLNNSYFELYNDKGKLLQAISHGMSNPTLEESEARFLLYDRDRYKASVYNYSGELYSLELDKTIASADIGRDGTFAVVTDSDSYQNSVFVYNKNNELVYTWNSANYYITDVAVANNGDSIAVSLINSKAGDFESYVYILEYDSAEPKYRYTFADVVSSLTSPCKEYFVANGFDRAYSIPWNGKAELDLKVSGLIRCYDTSTDGRTCVIYGREDNLQDNRVAVLNSEGNISAVFEYKSNVLDVCITDEKIAVLTANAVSLYDLKGNLEKNIQCDVKGIFVGINENGDVLILDNSNIIKLN